MSHIELDVNIYCRNTLQDCTGKDFEQNMDDYFHFDVLRSVSHGYIEVLMLKQDHEFDINQMTIKANPIVCHSGLCFYLTVLKINNTIMSYIGYILLVQMNNIIYVC